MKILLSLVLLSIIGSISAQYLITGTWYNPSTSTDSSSYCCVPNSIDIYCSSNTTCTANYKYTGTVGSKCWRLFMSSSGSGNMRLSATISTYSVYYASDSIWGDLRFNFQPSNYTGTPKLSVRGYSTYSYDECSFTMNARDAPVSGGIGGLVFFIIIFLIIVTSASAKQYQKRQALIITQNLTHQQPIATAPGFNFNTARTIGQVPQPVVQVHQPQIVQQQVTYTAPNQFPNTQVNMNFNGNNGGFHVQGHY